MGERVAALEAIVAKIEQDVEELKADMKSIHHKIDRLIEKVNSDVDSRASKEAVYNLEKRVRALELKQAAWTGGGALLGSLIGWFSRYFIEGGGE